MEWKCPVKGTEWERSGKRVGTRECLGRRWNKGLMLVACCFGCEYGDHWCSDAGCWLSARSQLTVEIHRAQETHALCQHVHITQALPRKPAPSLRTCGSLRHRILPVSCPTLLLRFAQTKDMSDRTKEFISQLNADSPAKLSFDSVQDDMSERMIEEAVYSLLGGCGGSGRHLLRGHLEDRLQQDEAPLRH